MIIWLPLSPSTLRRSSERRQRSPERQPPPPSLLPNLFLLSISQYLSLFVFSYHFSDTHSATISSSNQNQSVSQSHAFIICPANTTRRIPLTIIKRLFSLVLLAPSSYFYRLPGFISHNSALMLLLSSTIIHPLHKHVHLCMHASHHVFLLFPSFPCLFPSL